MNRNDRARSGAQTLRQELTQLIADGHSRPGDKVPPERDLADRYGVSRNTVRRVLDTLQADGWIERHVGCGTFVRSVVEDNASAGPSGLDSRSVNPQELMEARILIEPMLARLVVSRASERELEELQALVRAGGKAGSMKEFEELDNKLHRAIALASKNKYLIQIVDGIHEIRQSATWSNLSRRGLNSERRKLYQINHEKIVEALSSRDGEKAEGEILSHLKNVRKNLLPVE